MHKIFDKNNINEITIKNSIVDYLKPMMEFGSDFFISNVNAEIKILEYNNCFIPLIIAEKNYDDSLVSSFYSHFISYPILEMQKIENKFLRAFLTKGLDFIGKIVKKLNFNKIVYVNNMFLSTNLHFDYSFEQIKEITEILKQNFPKHAIVFKSIINKNQLSYFKQNNYKKITSRQVYSFSKERREKMSGYHKLKNKKDRLLYLNSKYNFETTKEDTNFKRLEDLYTQLYIEKYSIYNPKYKDEFFKLVKDNAFFELKILNDDKNTDGLLCVYKTQKEMTCPAIGYQLDKQKEGLYRMIVSELLNMAFESDKFFNMSAGVGDFKKQRGAKVEIEYCTIFYKHLSLIRRISYALIAMVVNFSIPKLIEAKQCGFVKLN